jgi:hypothetical protein
LARTLEEVNRLMGSRLPNGEPNMLERAWGVMAVASLFRLRSEQRDELLELLREARPTLAADPHVKRLLDLKAAEAELVRLYELGAIEERICRRSCSSTRRSVQPAAGAALARTREGTALGPAAAGPLRNAEVRLS